jgi:hypothetical protein
VSCGCDCEITPIPYPTFLLEMILWLAFQEIHYCN